MKTSIWLRTLKKDPGAPPADLRVSNAEKERTILSISLADLATAQTFVARVANSFPLHSRRPHLLRRSQHLRLGAAASWSRRTGAAHEEEGMRFGSRSTKSAEQGRRRSLYINWNAYPLSLFELVSTDGGQVD
ncbi:hypothetical protein EDB86DRAFT_2832601 [Lactarius hatsudake]|nr:hypothetical protein EDB86DRAFT_2832601 [Lactarius hatsudake]